MTTKQMLLSALILGATGNIGLATQETSTDSRHSVLNNIPVFEKTIYGSFKEVESTTQTTSLSYITNDSSSEPHKLFNTIEYEVKGVICNDEHFLIVNSNQKSDCHLVLKKYNALLQDNRRDLDYVKEQINDSMKKFVTETNHKEKEEIIETLTYWKKRYDESEEQVKHLEKTFNTMNATKKNES